MPSVRCAFAGWAKDMSGLCTRESTERWEEGGVDKEVREAYDRERGAVAHVDLGNECLCSIFTILTRHFLK